MGLDRTRATLSASCERGNEFVQAQRSDLGLLCGCAHKLCMGCGGVALPKQRKQLVGGTPGGADDEGVAELGLVARVPSTQLLR